VERRNFQTATPAHWTSNADLEAGCIADISCCAPGIYWAWEASWDGMSHTGPKSLRIALTAICRVLTEGNLRSGMKLGHLEGLIPQKVTLRDYGYVDCRICRLDLFVWPPLWSWPNMVMMTASLRFSLWISGMAGVCLTLWCSVKGWQSRRLRVHIYVARPQSKFPTRPTASRPYIAPSDCAYVIEQCCSMAHALTVLPAFSQ
jgi:hypothetical protein